MGKLRAGGGERVLQRVLGAPRSRNQERDLYRIPLRLRPDRPSFDDRFQLRGNHTDLEESAQEGRLDFFFFSILFQQGRDGDFLAESVISSISCCVAKSSPFNFKKNSNSLLEKKAKITSGAFSRTIVFLRNDKKMKVTNDRTQVLNRKLASFFPSNVNLAVSNFIYSKLLCSIIF